MSDFQGLLFFASAMLIVPAILAKAFVGVTWIQVGLAFPLFWLILALVLGFGRINEEVIGWTIIMSIFTSWLGVPLAALLLRLTSLPQRLF